MVTRPHLPVADLTHELSLSPAGTPFASFGPWPPCHADPVSPTRTACFEALFLLGGPTPAPPACLLIVHINPEKMTLLCMGGRQKGPAVKKQLKTLIWRPWEHSVCPLDTLRHPRNMEGARLLSPQGPTLYQQRDLGQVTQPFQALVSLVKEQKKSCHSPRIL